MDLTDKYLVVKKGGKYYIPKSIAFADYNLAVSWAQFIASEEKKPSKILVVKVCEVIKTD